ncbi:hypothetical protein AUK40_04400 [Candidatus Wirthbacteria bacterium CG2_30_54_11]|uniref:Uncharacterized protein n=1 Tax=Candidatus Wirthbacteria bacterium CG2_30_54_11 TaxID=1817892 RepID=A0A1J5IXA6_9BACT|nr:MAG: hypothetical protein AUK40_04400 [Candidatus Wirthbacteria bacterium CG2_30_54_11]
MQAVILAAGRSTRCYPLTLTRPKPLLPLLGTTILGHTLGELKGLVDEVLIVVGYQAEAIRKAFGDEFEGMPIRYILQGEQKGTAHALQAARELIKDRFLVLGGDDVYFREDLKRCLEHQYCVLAAEHPHPEQFGVLKVQGDIVEDIIEKPEKAEGNLVGVSVYMFDRSIFDLQIELSSRGELELVDYIRLLPEVKWEKVQTKWLPISYPWNLLEANVSLLQEQEPSNQGRIEENVHLEGTVIVGKNTVIKSGTVITGPVYIGSDCIIGPNAYFRPDTIIGDHCQIGFGVEIVDSVLLDHVVCKHRSYIGHSVIGAQVNIGAGFITADFRADGSAHITQVNGKKVDTHREKLGCFLGDGVFTGIHTSMYPGRKVWPGLMTLPGEVLAKDKTV